MAYSGLKTEFTVWGADSSALGPLDLPALISWVKSNRVKVDTWVFVHRSGMWLRALDVPELTLFFQARVPKPAARTLARRVNGLDPRALRRLKLLAFLTDAQLERFAGFVEVERAPQRAVIVKQGDKGDAMFVILEGEVSVSMKIGGRPTLLANLEVGDFFGDLSLFDHGPRSADVVASVSSALLKISAPAFDRLSREAPDLATPFLRAIGKTLTARIRAGNKHHGEAVKFTQMD